MADQPNERTPLKSEIYSECESDDRNEYAVLGDHIGMQFPGSHESRSLKLLPPIQIASDLSHQGAVPKSTTDSKRWLQYRKGCVAKDTTTLSTTEYETDIDRKNKKIVKSKHVYKCEVDIVTYLDRNRDFLEDYVIRNISVSELQRWLDKKKSQDPINQFHHTPHPKSYRNKKQKETLPKKEVFLELVNKLRGDTNEHLITSEIAHFMSSSIGVDAYRVYKLFPDHPTFVQYFATGSVDSFQLFTQMIKAEPDQTKFVLETAKRGTILCVSRYEEPNYFPNTPFSLFKAFGIDSLKRANYILYQPILAGNGKPIYVIEMWRIKDEFNDQDKEISSNFIVWGSLILHYCNLYLDKKRERNMSDFLLDVVKAIFEEMVSLDHLIKRILEFAQKLVNADRASLFLVDYTNFELVSTVFDLKFEPGHGRDIEKKEIRMPINRGIAGHVALSGETMNIPDAYSDYRFNREVDEATGYKTMNILCMPVKVQGRVIGVVQMVNKRSNDNFDHEDEVAFEIFATFFGLALHHAKLYDKIMRNEQKYRVALEILSYHNTCKEHEVQEILADDRKFVGNVNDFYIDPYQLDDFQKCKAVIHMFEDLFGLSRFNVMSLTRFILTVKKNYRTVPYHNFDHGWSVAQAMYVIIKHDVKRRFDYKMRLALFVASLCHDLDHRGYTNKYMNETASPLAAMYTTSPLEHHHFNITVTILQQDGHNIFSRLSSEDFKDTLRYIRHCILATDLAVFFPNLAKLNELVNNDYSQNNKFNWAYPTHRDLGMAIAMTAADLSASAKPWEIQIKTVKVIFEEFYDQGDKERAAGKSPIPMMDRNKPEEQPASQIGFLSQICIPCYSMLQKILPKTKPMYVMAMKNLNNWRRKAKVAQPESERNDCSNDEEPISEIGTESEQDHIDEKEVLREANDESINHLSEELNTYEDCNKLKDSIDLCDKELSVLWDEEQELNRQAEAKHVSIWQEVESSWTDDEDLVTRPNNSLNNIFRNNSNDTFEN